MNPSSSAFEAATIPADEVPVFARSEEDTPSTYFHYVIEQRADGALWELGRGGMGVTYKATDTNLHCPVALKIIGPRCFGGEKSRQRFVREARLAAQIRHPNAAGVYHLGCQDGEYFYAMEFIDGITADAWVRGRGAMPVEMALDVAMQVTRALTAADHLRVVHRDIKPGNIMLLPDPADRNRVIVKVIDFGLARSVAAEQGPELTNCGFIGTPKFASPEQVENLELDIRSDIYALGCTLWFLLKGEAPFNGATARVIAEHLTGEPPWSSLPGVPKNVLALLRRMLAKDPAQRPQTPVLLYAEITACREALSLTAKRRQSRTSATVALRHLRLAAAQHTSRPLRRAALWGVAFAALLAAILWPVLTARHRAAAQQEATALPAEAARAAEPFPGLPASSLEDADPRSAGPLQKEIAAAESEGEDSGVIDTELPPVASLAEPQTTSGDIAAALTGLGLGELPGEWTPPPVWPQALPTADGDALTLASESIEPNLAFSDEEQTSSGTPPIALQPAAKKKTASSSSKSSSQRSRQGSGEKHSSFRPLQDLRRHVQGFVRRVL